MYQISNYHEPREGKEPGPKPACLEQYENKRSELTRRTGGAVRQTSFLVNLIINGPPLGTSTSSVKRIIY
jgi:hypothetical protein